MKTRDGFGVGYFLENKKKVCEKKKKKKSWSQKATHLAAVFAIAIDTLLVY